MKIIIDQFLIINMLIVGHPNIVITSAIEKIEIYGMNHQKNNLFNNKKPMPIIGVMVTTVIDILTQKIQLPIKIRQVLRMKEHMLEIIKELMVEKL